MTVRVINAQSALPIDVAAIDRVARCAIKRLRIRTPGKLTITCLGPRRMRTLNKRFLRHDWATDVLSFRYDGEVTDLPRHAWRRRVIGDIMVAPAQARAYARAHGIPYEEELLRYVIHGLLHWLGHEDHTARQQRTMRAMEDQLLLRCGVNRRPIGNRGPRRLKRKNRLSPRLPVPGYQSRPSK